VDPFNGRFLTYGGQANLAEGECSGDLIVIAYRDRETAHT
jgi:uncharacterized protein (DUF1330 family)